MQPKLPTRGHGDGMAGQIVGYGVFMGPILPMLAQQVNVDDLSKAVDTGGLDRWDWIVAGITLVVAFSVATVARRLVVRVLRHRGSDGFASDLVGRLVSALIAVAGLIYALSTLGVRVGPLLGALGIVGVALAFAFKDILENFVAGVILQIRRPFDRGDQIISGDHEGTVLDVNMRSVVIDDPDGSRVIIPSGALITQTITNLTAHPLRRTTLEVGVDYETDLDLAVKVVTRAVEEVDSVAEVPGVEVLTYEFADSSVGLVVRYWHGSTIAETWRIRDAVARSVKRSLDDAGITIPFPQRVLSLRDATNANGEGMDDEHN
jgi:small conductance mechanosensitive channel